MSTDTGGAAFPRTEMKDGRCYLGMSLLDYFAAHVITSMKTDDYLSDSNIARDAYNIAQAMVEEKRRRESDV